MHSLSLSHSFSALQYLFYYYIHFDTSSDVGPVFVCTFFPLLLLFALCTDVNALP